MREPRASGRWFARSGLAPGSRAGSIAARVLGSAIAVLLSVGAPMGCDRDGGHAAHEGTPGEPTLHEGGTERPATLIFGLTPYLTPDDMRGEYQPLADYLSRELGIPTQVRVASSYAELGRELVNYEVHIAALSPFAYVRAKRDNPGIILIATHIADGSSTYSAYIVAREDSGIESIEQLKGKRFGFVDRSSASGYLYPLAYLRSLGLEPDTFFSNVEFTGNHQVLVEKVSSGALDAGASFSVPLKSPKAARMRILAKTGRIPYDAYCANPRLDSALLQQIRSLLLKLSTRSEEGRQVLGRLTNINGFVAVGDDHYDEVRRVERLIEPAPSPPPPSPGAPLNVPGPSGPAPPPGPAPK